MRVARFKDFWFILSLFRAGVKKGHFEAHSTAFFTRELLITLAFPSGAPRHFVWEQSGKLIGFMTLKMKPRFEDIPTFKPDVELYIASISPKYRAAGNGKKMILETLSYLEGKHLCARCMPESEIMFQILINNGFRHIGTTLDSNKLRLLENACP